MTIRWAGGEDHNFTALRTSAVVDTGGTFNSSRCRCSLRANAFAGPEYQFEISGSPLTEIYLHFDLWHDVGTTEDSQVDANMVQFQNIAIGRMVSVGFTNNLLRITVDNDGGGTTNIFSGGAEISNFQVHTVDIHINTTVSPGSAEVFVDGSSRTGVVEGNVNDKGAAGVDRIVMLGPFNASTARNYYYSQIMVDDAEDLRDWSLQTRIPDRDGEYGSWAGSLSPSFDSLTNISLNNNFLTSNIADELSSFSFQDLPGDIGDLVPRAVVNTASASRGAAGPQNLQLGLRVTDDSPGSDHFSSDIPLNTVQGPVYQIDAINPHTGSLWTVAEVNALESILKSRT